MKVDTIQTSFVGGEFAPALFGRTDIAQYANACAEVENFLIRPYGSIISTPGTEFINACKTGGSTSIVRLIEFIFSRTDSYVIEIGVGYFRFYTDGAVVVSSGTTPYEVAHTYTATEIFDIQFAQLNDIIYLAHPNHAPAKLTRISANSWTLTAFAFTGGPFLPDNTTSVTINPSATAGTVTLAASGNIFTASSSTLGHVNTFWAINASVTDSTTGLSIRGYVYVTAVTNPSTATGTVIKTLKATGATTTWAEGSWSDVRGWPARVTFHEQRLFFARTAYQPQNVWGSQPFTYENFAVNSGLDDDALDIQLASTESNDIKWLISGDKLIAGTYGGDFAIGSGDGSPLTPSNTRAAKQNIWGSEAIPPRRIGNFFYYIQRFAMKLREIFFNFDTNSYKSVDKTILAPHIAGTGGFKQIAYQQNPDTVLWAICSNGTLATLTREIDQEVQGWARQVTDGYYESVASIPSQDGPHDEIWVVVKRNINGVNVRYIERFKSQLVPDRQDQCFYVHSGLTYDAYLATTSPTSTSMSFSFPNSVTKLLMHYEGDNGSMVFTDSAAAQTVTASGNVQIDTSVKKFGNSSGYFPNVLGNDSFTKILLHFENNLTDSSASAKTFTNNGATFSSTIYKFGGYAAEFDGVSSYIHTSDDPDFAAGSSDLNYNMWLYPTSDANQYVFAQGDSTIVNGIFLNITPGSGYIGFFARTAGVYAVNLEVNSSPLLKNVLSHLSISRASGVWSIRVNGVAQTLITNVNGTIGNYAFDFEIGRINGGSYYSGIIDEFSYSLGTPRWTADFLVPKFPFTSIGDSLSLADSANWYTAANNFTIHKWVNFDDLTNGQYLIGQYEDANNLWYLYKDSNANGNKLKLYFRSGGADKANYIMTSAWSGATINIQYHIAAIRSSSTVMLAINGVTQTLTATTPISNTDVGNVAAPLVIGQQNSTGYFSGHEDELVFLNGQALWTGDFDVPTAPSSQSGTTALVTTSAAYFSAGNVGKRIRTIDANGVIGGQMTITGYTSSTIVTGMLTQDFSAFTYAAGLWGVSVRTISGLGHLESETVSVLGDGVKDSPNKVVSSGSITLTADCFIVNVGLPYTQKIETLPQEAGSQRGTSQGKIQRINQVALKVNDSYTGFKIGGADDSLDTLTPVSPSLYTGTIANVFFKDDYRYGSQVVIQNPDPLPIEILALITTIDTNDK